MTVTTAWEYKLVSLMKLARGADAADEDAMARSIETELNTLGADGWELCLNVHNGLILKRPK